MAAAAQPKNLVRRMTNVFRKSEGQQTALPDYPTERCSEKPESFQLDLSAKWNGKNRPRNRRKKVRGILDNGHLELRDRSRTDSVGLSTIVDLARVTVKISERRATIVFGPTDKVILTPNDQKLGNTFKCLVKNHRLYRQELVSREKNMAGPCLTTTISTITVTDDFRGWDTDPTCFKVLDAVKEMQQLTLTVLEKSTKCLAEMKTINEEERALLGLAKPRTAVSIVSTVTKTGKPSASSSKATTPNAQPPPDSEDDEDSEDSEELELSEATERELFSTRTKTKLTSMEVARTEAEIQSKKEVLTRVQKVLDLPKPVITIPLPPPPQPEKIQSKRNKVEKKIEESVVNKQVKARRTLLPSPQVPGDAIGFKAFTQMVVSKLGLPLTQYEPLGLVQVVCEELYFANLLDQAAVAKSPEERMSLVTGFAFSTYLTKVGRSRKPFNPILGETFDYEEAGWRYHGEQVSHHPPITAGHADGKGWSFWSTFQLETTFSVWRACFELKMEHPQRVRLRLADGTVEDYSWQKVHSKIEGLTATPEQRRVSHEGVLQVQSSSRHLGRLLFKRMKDPTEVTGDVLSPNDRVCYRLHGYWNKYLNRTSTTGLRDTLISEKQLHRYPDYYGFNQFSMGLNEPETNLPPSDSRHRLDMRQLEAGSIASAQHYKQVLEAAQRTRKERQQLPTQPLWFDLVTDEMTRKQIYCTNGKYWQAKSRQFEGVKSMVETRCV